MQELVTTFLQYAVEKVEAPSFSSLVALHIEEATQGKQGADYEPARREALRGLCEVDAYELERHASALIAKGFLLDWDDSFMETVEMLGGCIEYQGASMNAQKDKKNKKAILAVWHPDEEKHEGVMIKYPNRKKRHSFNELRALHYVPALCSQVFALCIQHAAQYEIDMLRR